MSVQPRLRPLALPCSLAWPCPWPGVLVVVVTGLLGVFVVLGVSDVPDVVFVDEGAVVVESGSGH